MIPTDHEIKNLHRSCAPNDDAFTLIYTHCLIVCDIVDQILSAKPELEIDRQIVRSGALLHDIGAYSLYTDHGFDNAQYLTHGIRGEVILTRAGIDPRIARIASHHTGVGITRSEIRERNLPLPDADFLANTIEEELVMYADKFHSKKPVFNLFSSYLKQTATYDPENAARFRAMRDRFGEPDIMQLANKYGHPIK